MANPFFNMELWKFHPDNHVKTDLSLNNNIDF